MDRSVPQGAPVAASEQLQPVYETKTLVQQNGQLLQSIESHLQVRGVWAGVASFPDSNSPAFYCTIPWDKKLGSGVWERG